MPEKRKWNKCEKFFVFMMVSVSIISCVNWWIIRHEDKEVVEVVIEAGQE